MVAMKSVVVCGSKRFKKEISKFCEELEKSGVLVFAPNFDSPVAEAKEFESEHIKRMVFKGLTLEHFDWIRKAEVCFVFNKDGYVGVSVTMEMAYASALGKPVMALNKETGDPCRDALIDRQVTNVEELVRLL